MGEGVVGREHHVYGVLRQRDGEEIELCRQYDEAAVELSAPCGFFHLVLAFVGHKFVVYIGMVVEKHFHDAGKPLHGNAAEGGDAQTSVFNAAKFFEAGLQRLLACAHVLYPGEEVASVGREACSRVVACEKGGSHLLLERAHHVADTRLGVAQDFGGFFETARFRDGDERFVFLVRHELSCFARGCAPRACTHRNRYKEILIIYKIHSFYFY